jgi:hypothetical protein
MATTLFNLTASGSGSNGANLWIDLGLIPTSYRMWIGNWTVYGAKTETFYLYTNKTGQSTASTTACTLLAQIAPKAGATVTQDLYKKGTLHTTTVYGTGVEHWWINIVAKSSTSASYNYKILYTTE